MMDSIVHEARYRKSILKYENFQLEIVFDNCYCIDISFHFMMHIYIVSKLKYFDILFCYVFFLETVILFHLKKYPYPGNVEVAFTIRKY